MKLSEMQGMICEAAFVDDELAAVNDASPVLDEACRQIQAYFAGDLKCFSLPVMRQGTAFEKEVSDALLGIPYAQTRSYAEIARMIGRTGAARAVGRACAHNPILVIVPCHRVIASDGKLTGYAAGVEIKRALLALERKNRI